MSYRAEATPDHQPPPNPDSSMSVPSQNQTCRMETSPDVTEEDF